MKNILLIIWLFSSIFLNGCVTKYVKVTPPPITENISIPADVNFTIYKKNDKICMSKKQFKLLIKNYITMKEKLKEVNKSIVLYNKMLLNYKEEK